MRRRLLLATSAVAAAVVTACSGGASSGPAWLPVSLGTTAPLVQVAGALGSTPPWPWAVTGTTRAGAVPAAAVWHSADGTRWERSPMRGLTLDAPQNLVYSVARRGSVAVALGETPGMAHGNPRPTIWRSTDGIVWDEVPTLREDFGGPRLTDLPAVTAGPLGFAVVGNWTGDDGRPLIAVWLSADGLRWTRIDHDPALTGRPGEELTAMDIASGPGGLAVVGESFLPTDAHPALVDGFIATSPDGRVWHRVDVGRSGLHNGGQVAVRRVIATGTGFVAFGTRTQIPRTDLVTWRPSPSGTWLAVPIATTGVLTATAATLVDGSVWLAVVDGRAVRMWRSAGAGWRTVAAPPGSSEVDNAVLASGANRVLLAVQRGAAPRVWTAPTR